jgi:hypothetical protein
MDTAICQKAGTDPPHFSDFKCALKLTQRRAVVVVLPVCPLTSAAFSDVSQHRLVVTDVSAHAVGGIFKSQASTS